MLNTYIFHYCCEKCQRFMYNRFLVLLKKGLRCSKKRLLKRIKFITSLIQKLPKMLHYNYLSFYPQVFIDTFLIELTLDPKKYKKIKKRETKKENNLVTFSYHKYA